MQVADYQPIYFAALLTPKPIKAPTPTLKAVV